MITNIIVLVSIFAAIAIFTGLYYNKYKNTPKERQVTIDKQNLYAGMSREQLVIIGAVEPLTPEEQDVIDYENDLETIKNHPIYSTMSKEQLEIIGITCLTPKERAEKRKEKEERERILQEMNRKNDDSRRRNNDFFYSPMYRNYPGNIYNK